MNNKPNSTKISDLIKDSYESSRKKLLKLLTIKSTSDADFIAPPESIKSHSDFPKP